MLTFLVLATLGLIGGFTGLLFFAAYMSAKERRLERERRRAAYHMRWRIRGELLGNVPTPYAINMISVHIEASRRERLRDMITRTDADMLEMVA